MSRVFGKNLENNLNKCKQQFKKEKSELAEISSNIGKENCVNDSTKQKGYYMKTDKSMNPQCVDLYINEIYEYLLENDIGDPTYSLSHSQINEMVRIKIVESINQIVEQFCLLQSTMFMTIDLFDQCIKLFDPKVNEVELIAITCLFMSTKFEEIYPPPLQMLIKDTSLSNKAVIQKEKEILIALNFRVISNNTLIWVDLLSKLLDCNEQYLDRIKSISQLIAEITIKTSLLVPFKKCQIAASIFLIIEIILGAGKAQFKWCNLKEKPDRNHRIMKILTYLIHDKSKQIRDRLTF